MFQIAAHEDVVPVEELYRYCEIAREMLSGEHGVGRVIARPFGGEHPFVRLPGRHDYSLVPPKDTVLDLLKDKGMDVISVGKIYDIFAGKGLTESNPTVSNMDGMDKTIAIADRDFCGLCFTNLVDFDSSYGHRNDAAGYANALSEFDAWLPKLMEKLGDEDVVMITADHGCDPGYAATTDHTREYVPLMILGKAVKPVNLGTRTSFADIAATVAELLDVKYETPGQSFAKEIL